MGLFPLRLGFYMNQRESSSSSLQMKKELLCLCVKVKSLIRLFVIRHARFPVAVAGTGCSHLPA